MTGYDFTTDWVGRMANSRDRRRLYGDLAWTWPIVSPSEHYVGESETFAGLVRAHGRGEMKSLLNLGSGGGHNDWTLKHHFTVTGIDRSADMQGLAKRLNPEVEYIAGDMRDIRLGRLFDAVVCFDSIDYMLDEGDLTAAFTTAYEHLRPGGVFLTYAEVTRESFVEGRVRAVRGIGDDGTEIIFVETDHDPDPTDSTIECGYVYLIRENGEFRVEADHHLTGIFAEARWPVLLEAAGFEVRALMVDVWDEAGEEIPTFLGVKPG
jgi:SAM-dependent methyltransferase